MNKTRPFALTLLALAPFGASGGALAGDYLFAVTTDYETSGQCGRMNMETPWNVETGLEPVGSDPAVRSWRNRIYVINRLYADAIQVIDPASDYETVLEFSVGAGSNPQDIAFATASKAYVTRYESVWLYEVDPGTGAIVDSVDLSSFADADGLPEMAQTALWGGRLFVQVQRIDRNTWTPVSPAYLAVIDVATNALVDADPGLPGVQGIALAGKNPNGPMRLDADAGRLYVGCTGNYLAEDGGVERVDLRALATEGFVMTEAALGGDLGVIATDGAIGFAAVSDDWFFSTRIVSFDVATGAPLDTLYSTDGYVPDIEYDPVTSHLFVADRKITAPGVIVFDGTTGARLTPSPLSLGLPPADLEIVRGVDAGIPGGAESEMMIAGRAAWAQPNPFRSGTNLFFRAPASGGAEGMVYDLRGRLVRLLEGPEAAANGFAYLPWDGRDEGGRPVPPGTYFYRIETSEGVRKSRVTVVR
ncbi:MAG: T9SS type A sorting domain-containing protein [Candidatus Eisenbacteria bacterium]